MREEDALLDRLAAAGSRRDILEVALLAALDPPLARRAVLRWWRRHGSPGRLGRLHVEAARELALRPSGDGEVSVPGGAIVRTQRHLRFRPGVEAACSGRWQLSFAPGQNLDTPGGWRLHLGEAQPGTTVDDAGRDVCLVDADQVPATLVVRNRRPGDRIRALGLGGHVSIKRLFVARQVPRHLRHDHPLVLCGEEPLWVPGCARSDRALVGPTTARCYVIRVLRRPSEYA